MTLDSTKVKVYTAIMALDDTFVDAMIDVAAAQIEAYIGVITVSKWTDIPAIVPFAAAKLIKMWYEENARETGVASETRSSSSQSYERGASGLPVEVEVLLKPLLRMEAFQP